MIRVITVVALFAAGSAHAIAPDKLYSMLAPSIWRVVASDSAGKAFSQGSAVVIGPETLLTNCHVLAKASSFVVRQGAVSVPAKLQYIDIERDMCQISAPTLKAPAVRLGDSDKVAVGQRIYTLGNPLGMELTLSDGLVSAIRKDDKQAIRYLQISAPISPGSSGGGLFDDDGALIGITSAGMDKGQNLNLAIPIGWQRELAERSRAALAVYASGARSAAGSAAGTQVAARPSTPPLRAPEVGQRPPPSAPAPATAAYAAIDDINKLLAVNPFARAAYEEFLTRPLPRAFALGVPRGWWSAWTTTPKNPADDPNPAVRVLTGCERFHNSPCVLYAVDNVVVYQPRQPRQRATPPTGTP
ncbi:S1C family serine protease [Massilia sp. PWRC2]|uniref:S1C family serine protease n=1 Tax=Massilia sp. PWRC2 TaxID=2804626 RepID=UPI003CE7593B